MGNPVRIKSYYAASAHSAADRAELETSVNCDVCVVGGGIAGCSTALHLAERGSTERFDVFAKIPHRNFPIPALRRPALALGMLYYQLRDLL